MKNIFYTSDTHFFHNNIIKYCPNSRGQFNNVEEMNEAIIAAWNDKVTDHDIVYHLGDVSFSNIENTAKILSRLKGKINLIPGNHDKTRLTVNTNISTVLPQYCEIKAGKQFFILCHYPILSWNGQSYGAIHLHGHTHGTLAKYHNNALDVGIDARPNYDLSPWEQSELIEYIRGL